MRAPTTRLFSTPGRLTAILTLIGALALSAQAQDAGALLSVRAPASTISLPDTAPGDILGYSVAASGDRVVLGAAADDAAGEDSGAAYVVRRSGAGWETEAKLIPSRAVASDFFGAAVAIDGDRAIVGALGHDARRGGASVFVRTADGWAEEAALVITGPAADDGGVSVAIEGDRAVVGAAHRNGERGIVRIYARADGAWALEAELALPDGEPGDRFGRSIALQGDRLAVGAFGRNDSQGAVYVYDRQDGTWTTSATLTAPAGGRARMGVSVALDGDAVLAGAPFDAERGTESGAAYLFDLSRDEHQKITAPGGTEGDLFGWSVSIRNGRALVGARQTDASSSNGGSAFLFLQGDSGWLVESVLLGGTTPNANAGLSVALADDLALVGAPYQDASRGTVLAFSVAGATSAEPVADGALSLTVAPNPAVSRAEVLVELAEAADVRAEVYDALGRRVSVLADGARAAGPHRLPVGTAGLAPGVYVVRVVAGAQASATRFTVAR